MYGHVNKENLTVRKAINSDIDSIMDVACSVGNENKIHSSGFLMDDYVKDYDVLKNKFLKLIDKIRHFYVIEDKKILGFLIAYKREEWLYRNPTWMDDIIWSPGFDKKRTDKFILVDKTAVLKGLTGMGLGSRMYKALTDELKEEGIFDMFAETIISPKPNFASLEFRMKQNYSLAGVRYESYNDTIYTDLIYHKQL